MGDKITHIGQLKFDKRNPRKHNPRNIGVIVNSLQQVGPARSIVIDEDDSILAGNGVTEAAAIAGIEKVIEVEADGDAIIAVRRRGLTEDQKQKLKYFDNRSGELAGWDIETILADIEAGVKLDDLFNQDELAALLEEAGNELLKGAGGKDVAPQLDKAKELAELWGTEVGQVWQLGEHRLAVGDCTDRAVVEAVMRGEKPQLLLTDVPYDVSQNGRFDSYNFGITKAPEFEHFDKGFDPLPFLSLFFEIMPSGANWFIFVGAFHMGVPVYQFLIEKLMVCSTWVWVKKYAVHNISRVGYAKAYELAIYAWDKPHYFNTLEGVDSYDYGFYANNEGGRSYDHATSKPLALFNRCIEQLSDVGYIVIDPFLGSGTTLIACEQLGRKARCIELDPGYAAISIQRWIDLTSQQPTRLTG